MMSLTRLTNLATYLVYTLEPRSYPVIGSRIDIKIYSGSTYIYN